MRQHRKTIEREMGHMRHERWADVDLETRPPYRPPLVPPTEAGQQRLRRSMMNRGIPLTRSVWEAYWGRAQAEWAATPEGFRADYASWSEACDYYAGRAAGGEDVADVLAALRMSEPTMSDRRD